MPGLPGQTIAGGGTLGSNCYDAPVGHDAFVQHATNTFSVRATGGVWFVTGINGSGTPSTGCSIGPNGGSWECTSTREAKTDFQPTDVRLLLERIVELPIDSWRFKGEPGNIKHIEPMAEDFHAAFGLGRDNKTIATADIEGVTIAPFRAYIRPSKKRTRASPHSNGSSNRNSASWRNSARRWKRW